MDRFTIDLAIGIFDFFDTGLHLWSHVTLRASQTAELNEYQDGKNGGRDGETSRRGEGIAIVCSGGIHDQTDQGRQPHIADRGADPGGGHVLREFRVWKEPGAE